MIFTQREALAAFQVAFAASGAPGSRGGPTGKRTRSLLEALAWRLPVTYYPIEISGAALARCEQEIGQVRGSSVGNFDLPAADEFLRQMRALMGPGDSLLLETDLVKPAKQLLDAYDDPIGLTAAFNLNILARLNRELGADFQISEFAHLARYNPQHQRIEMHLRSKIEQRVRIPAAQLEVSFAADETIWTENSHKYPKPLERRLAP